MRREVGQRPRGPSEVHDVHTIAPLSRLSARDLPHISAASLSGGPAHLWTGHRGLLWRASWWATRQVRSAAACVRPHYAQCLMKATWSLPAHRGLAFLTPAHRRPSPPPTPPLPPPLACCLPLNWPALSGLCADAQCRRFPFSRLCG